MKLCGSCYSTSCCTKRFTELVGFRPKWITLHRKRKLKLSSSTIQTLLFLGTLGTLHWETFCQVRACLTCMLARKQVSSLSSFLSTPCPPPCQTSCSTTCHPACLLLVLSLPSSCLLPVIILIHYLCCHPSSSVILPCPFLPSSPVSSLPSFLSNSYVLPAILPIYSNFLLPAILPVYSLSPSCHPSCQLHVPFQPSFLSTVPSCHFSCPKYTSCPTLVVLPAHFPLPLKSYL